MDDDKIVIAPDDESAEMARLNPIFDNPLFDNPLATKILTKTDVAALFKKSVKWVERNTDPDRLPCRYVGDTAMYYLDEVICAFLDGKLAQPRRTKRYEHNKAKEQGQLNSVRSRVGNSGSISLSELRVLRRG